MAVVVVSLHLAFEEIRQLRQVDLLLSASTYPSARDGQTPSENLVLACASILYSYADARGLITMISSRPRRPPTADLSTVDNLRFVL